MSNEYNYNGLYNNPQQPGNAQNAQAQGGYPNVGSTGLNTANTADAAPGATGGYSQPQPPHAAQQDAANGYTSTFAGGGNGGYNGYSYTSAPQQPPQKKKGGAKKVLLRVVAGVGVVALGFGGGYAGSVVASRTGAASGQVVVQQVQRPADTADLTAAAGSTDGNALTVAQVSAMVQPSVVAITTEKMTSSNTWFGGSYVQSGAGSGVIISQDGYILTCAHVVSGATNIVVKLEDDTEYTATIIASDSGTDVAVIKVDATDLTPAVIGDSDALTVGEDAIAVGNPLGTLGGTVTNGIVSALNREIQVEGNRMTLIQTNAAISPGNSGGGLFNAAGELIGIVNARSAASTAEGLAFAIPINTAMEVAQQLIEQGSVNRPVMGITVYTVANAETAAQLGVSSLGAYITTVTPGSGAEAAGVQAGDRIVSIDDTVVSTSSDVTDYLKDKAAGDVVALQVEREGKLQVLDVTLANSNAS